MQDLGIYPLPNGSPFEGNLCLICPILIFFLYVFSFSIPNGRGNPLRLSGRIRAGLFIPHQNVAITDRQGEVRKCAAFGRGKNRKRKRKIK